MLKKIFVTFSILLLIYLFFPGPTSINDFPALPDSTKSTLSGDTWQVPNVVGYFSNHYRQFVVSFYRQVVKEKTSLPFPPLRLNYPPEYAYIAIKDQTQSTYLEEYSYPLRESLFVNGFEPYFENGQPKFWGSTQFEVDGRAFYTKTTLRFYPVSWWVKLLVWLGINISVILLWKVSWKLFHK